MEETNVPLSKSAVLSPRILPHLALKKNGEILLVFPRGTVYDKVADMAKNFDAEIYICYVRISYDVLAENKPYDHSPRITL